MIKQAIAPTRITLLPLLAALVLAGCATAPGNEPAPDTTAAVAAVAPAADSAPAADATTSTGAGTAVAEALDAAEARQAVGTPIDPLDPELKVDLDDATAQRDLWLRVRKGFAMPDLDTALVRKQEQWYASRPDYVQRMTERSGRYLFHIVAEVEKRGMPTELALLPFIESAFNPQAMSHAKASGMWQFMPATGRDYELRQNVFRDDRRDILASTRAALDYLQRLYGMFGDWQLALAAYNWGEGSVARAIARNEKAGKPTDYLSLRMPAETANYVPKLQAVKNIVARPADFGLALQPIENHPYFLSVPIQRDIDAALVAQLAGMPLAEFQALNPSLNKPVILAAGTPQLLLPYENAQQFVRTLPEHRGPLASWTAWVVPSTMKPAEAAKRVGMGEAQLREVNRIPPKMLVKGGSTLLVPRSAQRDADVSDHLADNASLALAPERLPGRRVVVKAKPKDSVASVARRYGVSAGAVAQWNSVSAGSAFQTGQQVVLYLPKATSTGKAKTRSAKAASGTRKAAATSGGRKVAQTGEATSKAR
ncbi:transglycosylase SLT domain-containing protein [Rivibacter subsaxonicus]|uniref:Membrane-bound lytic murein transglycosylase D n=1 Tax=Rivibacter subsaxonicus TaxID=457575 RepID=A0A4V2FTE1_9BURK|nr:transglycosylase SLT domain-containing protein [Rivibacter subsaxonicus]RZT97815.1 membrane-bound lytic murein transglycosylase D [Rivibacter subsaxonicus]